MRKLFYMLLMMGCLVGAACGAEAPEAFRGIKWGTHLKDIPGMVFDSGEARLKTYTRENDKMAVGAAPLESVLYNFLDDRFVGAVLICQNGTPKETLMALFQNLYGKPMTMDGFPNSSIWVFEKDKVPTFFITADPFLINGLDLYRFAYYTPEGIEYIANLQKSGANDL